MNVLHVLRSLKPAARAAFGFVHQHHLGHRSRCRQRRAQLVTDDAEDAIERLHRIAQRIALVFEGYHAIALSDVLHRADRADSDALVITYDVAAVENIGVLAVATKKAVRPYPR